MCNINGLAGIHKYIQVILNETNPDIVILSKTNLKRPIIPHIDIGTNKYKLIKVKITNHCRGVMAILTRQELALITAELIREEHGNNFIHAVVLINKRKEAVVGWYNSPGTRRQYFKEKLENIMQKYNVRCLVGDLKARHPLWCTTNDDQRRGRQLLESIKRLKSVRLYAPEGPTFEAIKCKKTG